MFYSTINLYGYKKPYIDHGSKIVQTVGNEFVQADQRTEQGVCDFPEFAFSVLYKDSTEGCVTMSCNVHWFLEMLCALKLCSKIQDLFLSSLKFCFLNLALVYCGFISLFCRNPIFLGKVSLLSIINAMVAHFPEGTLNISGRHAGDYCLVFDPCNFASAKAGKQQVTCRLQKTR